MTTGGIRPVVPHEHQALAHIWHEAWHDAHDAHVPAALIDQRTLESFAHRLEGFGDRLRVAGPEGAPTGLCVIHDDELDQLFVARSARGGGIAALLLADGEARLRANGVTLARLSCVVENVRAVRFYAKHGWVADEIATVTVSGPFELQALMMRKRLVPQC